MTGESTIDVKAVAWHLLSETPVPPARVTDGAVVAGHHRGDDDFLTDPTLVPGYDPTAYLVAKC
jgi:hypothetical protein